MHKWKDDIIASIETIIPKDFIFKVLPGVVIGVVASLVPNAILGEIFKYFMDYHLIFKTLLGVAVAIQFMVPALIGTLVAMKFDLLSLVITVVTSTAYVGSGTTQFKNGAWMVTGISDLTNTMTTTAIAVLFILLTQHCVGSMALIVFPAVAGGISGAIGVLILPYTKMIITAVGNMVNGFTELQPIAMSILISVAFSPITISSLSTMAIAFTIGITGLAAGLASIGISVIKVVLIIGTSKVDRLGVPLSVFFGGVKTMVPNMVKYPILMLPILTTVIVSGLVSVLISIHGTKESVGSGFIGMVGLINAFKFMKVDSVWLSVLLIVVAFFAVPFVTAWLVDIIYRKVSRLCINDIFKFMG